MRILYVLSSSVMGGATHSVLTLIEGLLVRGNQVVVISPDMEGYLKDRLDEMNVPWHVIKLGFKEYPSLRRNLFLWFITLLRMLRSNAKATKIISNIIRKEKIDIVHTNVGPVTCGYEASRKTNTPHVWHIREYGDKDFNIKMFPSKKAFRKMLLKSNVITITKDLIRYNKLESSPIAHVIYNGVRKKEDTRYEIPKENFFLCANRISPEKGLDQTIRVFSRFIKAYPDYKMVILGFGDERYVSELKEKAKNLNIINTIVFEGYRKDVSDYMAKAKALIVASPNEGFGRMTVEAAFAGCLVIGKNTAGTKEILDVTGGFPFITDDEMLKAMMDVTNLNEDEYHSKAMIAQEKAVDFYSEEKYIDSVYNVYKTILSN